MSLKPGTRTRFDPDTRVRSAFGAAPARGVNAKYNHSDVSKARTCTYCGVTEEQAPLVALAAANICGDCARAARDVRDGFTVVTGDSTKCISCGAGVRHRLLDAVRRPAPVLLGAPLERELVAKAGSAICTDCLALCSAIVS